MEPIRIISSIQSPILLASTYYFREKKLLKIKAWKLLQKNYQNRLVEAVIHSSYIHSFILFPKILLITSRVLKQPW